MEEEGWEKQGGDGEISYRCNRFHNLICGDERKKLTNLFENVAKINYFVMTVTNKDYTHKEIPQSGGNF